MVFAATHPSVWLWCIIPLLINVLVAWLVWHWSGSWVDHLLGTYSQSQHWWTSTLHFLGGVAKWILRIVLVLVSVLVVGNLASLPFNDFLSARVDFIVTGYRDESPFEMRKLLLTLFHELKRLAFYLVLLAMLLLASLSGVLAPVALPAKLALTMGFIAADYLSYPMERRGVFTAGDKTGFVTSNLASALGFGAAMFLLAMVPLLNFLFIPLGTIGGTLLYADISQRRQLR